MHESLNSYLNIRKKLFFSSLRLLVIVRALEIKINYLLSHNFWLLIKRIFTGNKCVFCGVPDRGDLKGICYTFVRCIEKLPYTPLSNNISQHPYYEIWFPIRSLLDHLLSDNVAYNLQTHRKKVSAMKLSLSYSITRSQQVHRNMLSAMWLSQGYHHNVVIRFHSAEIPGCVSVPLPHLC